MLPFTWVPPWNPDSAAHYVGSPPGTWILAAFTSGRWLIALLLWRATTRARKLDFDVIYIGNPVEPGFCRYLHGSPPMEPRFRRSLRGSRQESRICRYLRGSPFWNLDFAAIYVGFPPMELRFCPYLRVCVLPGNWIWSLFTWVYHLWSLDFVSISGFRVLREPWFFPS